MYSRRLHSALGRSRSNGNEFSKLTDGVIASMRQLHLSAIHQQEDQSSSSEPDPPPPSKTVRSQNAAAEITSLPSSRGIDARSLAAKPPSGSGFSINRVTTTARGIDARSLAAKPPPGSGFSINSVQRGIDVRALAAKPPPGSGLKIIRVDSEVKERPLNSRPINRIATRVGRGGPGGFMGRGGGTMGRGGFMGRGGRGGIMGRGGFTGRGGRGRGGRARGRGGRRGRGRRGGPRVEADAEDDLYTPDEWKFNTARLHGVVTPAASGQITKESLLQFAPCTPMSSAGMINTIKDRMDILGQKGSHESADLLRKRLLENKYVSFRNEGEKEEVQRTLYPTSKTIKPVEYLDGKNAITKQLVGGEYEVLKPSKNPLYTIEQHLQQNGSYLDMDTAKVLEKVRSLLPAHQGNSAQKRTPKAKTA